MVLLGIKVENDDQILCGRNQFGVGFEKNETLDRSQET